MRKFLLAISIVALLALSAWGGMQVQKDSMIKFQDSIVLTADRAIAKSKRLQELSDVRNCLFYVDSSVLRGLITPTEDSLQKAVGALRVCSVVLNSYYSEETDEELRWTLSEAKLFYDGYNVTSKESLLLATELSFIHESPVAYTPQGLARIVELETTKQKQIEELGKFTRKLYTLIQGQW